MTLLLRWVKRFFIQADEINKSSHKEADIDGDGQINYEVSNVEMIV